MKYLILQIGLLLFCYSAHAQRGSIIQNAAEAASSANDRIDIILGTVPGIISGGNAVGDFPTLSAGECAPDFNESSNSRMSYQCAPESECQNCFTDAKDKMNFFRRQLARLNCIYQNTKNFTTSAVAFGDGASGVHAMTAIAWQRERAKINASFDNLKRTYDTRYIEFIQGLKASLMEFDACENRYGQGDWYQKSGFIYFEMMKERYKRND